MTGSKLLLDTNIVLYLLSGNEAIFDILDGQALYVSVITELELLSYPELTTDEANQIKEFLSQITVLDLSQRVKDTTTFFRRNYRVKLPDSIIAATSYSFNIPLITADKGFEKIEELELLLFQ
jgi:predicted nucleic acid-binding protein